MIRKPLIYLASCYTHASVTVESQRAVDAARALSMIFDAGQALVFSPVVHSHWPRSMFSNLGGTWDDWAEFDSRMITVCDEMWILTLDGWIESEGIAAEIEIARKQGKPIWLISPNASEPDQRLES